MLLFAEFALPDTFWVGVVGSMIFGVLGIILMLLGYFAFELCTRKLNVQEELHNGNVAVGIVVAALLIAISLIVGHVVN